MHGKEQGASSRSAAATPAENLRRAPPPGAPVSAPRRDALDQSQATEWRISDAAARPLDPLLECLAILASLFGRPHSAAALVAGLPLSDRLTPELFGQAAQRIGISARLAKVALHEISPLSLPCVLLLKGARACVLTALEPARAIAILPETGRGQAEIPFDRLETLYSGFAIQARPEAALPARAESIDAPPRRWWQDGRRRLRPLFAAAAATVLAINLVALALPLFALFIFDATARVRADLLPLAAAGALLALAALALLRLLRASLFAAAIARAARAFDGAVFEQIVALRLDLLPSPSGALTATLRDFAARHGDLLRTRFAAVIDMPLAAVFVAALAVVAGLPAILPALALITIAVMCRAMTTPLIDAAREAGALAAREQAFAAETVLAFETLKSAKAEGARLSDAETAAAGGADLARRSERLAQTTRITAGLVAGSTLIGVAIWGPSGLWPGGGSAGVLAAAIVLATLALLPGVALARSLGPWARARAAFESIDRIMALPVERPPGAKFLFRPLLRGAIEFRDVHFTYPGQQLRALAGVSFAIAAGERVALIGRIGSGKSTIERLIMGFYRPQHGSIAIDGADLAQIDPADLRHNIGYVPQEAVLLTGTVRENIALAAPAFDQGAVARAAQAAGVGIFCDRHPLGLDMPVGELGQALSGGQRQAVALARALLRDPPILVLDEPTGAMDKSSEDWIVKQLGERLEGKTLLLVTQRLSLLALVDRVIVMDAGTVVADGPRDEVLDALAGGGIMSAG